MVGFADIYTHEHIKLNVVTDTHQPLLSVRILSRLDSGDERRHPRYAASTRRSGPYQRSPATSEPAGDTTK
jgi:hypothetical protein